VPARAHPTRVAAATDAPDVRRAADTGREDGMRIAAGADHAGFDLKETLVAHLRLAGHDVVDVGTTSQESVDYPVFAHAVARAVAGGEVDRGLLVCGTGIGMCMAANRHRGVRAADCFSEQVAELSRRHNDANVLCLAGRFLDPAEAWAITQVWLATPFEGERHARRVALIEQRAEETGA
jgi:ribose 5-phosphate isomerase B